jgi:hypothetical protein
LPIVVVVLGRERELVLAVRGRSGAGKGGRRGPGGNR